ncbi:hypothetical protein HHO41_14080 [Bacillus sp. DNRA2]|uniref:hypothetical protein n=1 Tax=Bacillus sp. DNRA2 TaxID=2723053 RepID=UPI00145E0B3B|nr:hypothetical protein [Bacillus sp. DNRA2]NMD71430.1 hypothetical protein [Bacillus sp. DNRA2]
MNNKQKPGKLEALLWNIALPGFSQILSGQVTKGIFFVLSEMFINVFSHFNTIIMYSFLGQIQKAISTANYQWLMFYPCFYMFSLWDAYRFAMPESERRSYLPFVFGAFFVTVGLMISPKFKIFGVLLGPVFLPMLSLIPGLLVGFMIRIIILQFENNT